MSTLEWRRSRSILHFIGVTTAKCMHCIQLKFSYALIAFGWNSQLLIGGFRPSRTNTSKQNPCMLGIAIAQGCFLFSLEQHCRHVLEGAL